LRALQLEAAEPSCRAAVRSAQLVAWMGGLRTLRALRLEAAEPSCRGALRRAQLVAWMGGLRTLLALPLAGQSRGVFLHLARVVVSTDGLRPLRAPLTVIQ
jgi:hypothetical protein